ncbi:MAG: LacI family DNA-binding transcriptional regulator [Actinomycetales bacterium]|nr:LacI family DNA-binding transcriptional regulator [Actinomycetales bacterium]
MARARQKDIARHAGLSEATVSRVLNGHSGVSEATRQTVLTTLDVLGFERPTYLRRKSVGLVGLILPELTNPIFPAFAQIIETALARRGYTPILCTQTPGGVHEDDYVQSLLDHGVAGIINISGLHADTEAKPDRYFRLREIGLPLVLVNGAVEGLDVPTIGDDDDAAVSMAVGHLVALGHERIGLAAGPSRFVPVVRKVRSFRSAMSRRGVLTAAEVDSLIAHDLFTVEGGCAAAEQLLDRGVTAIVAASDLMALGATRAVRARGLRVPEDVSVVGYDDGPLLVFTDPPLTTLRQNVPAMGEAAVTALVDLIAGSPSTAREYVFRPELVVRGSTGPCVVQMRPWPPAASARADPASGQRERS